MDDYRAASRQGWSAVAGDWAELSEQIDRQLQPAAEWIIDALALQPGERVLELAGGPGTLSLLAAQAVGSSGQVIHSDFAEPMVEVARARFEAAGVTGVDARVIDAESIDLPDGSVDAVACRMGYMLMADPAAALRETARVLAPGGRVALAVWTNPGANPWVAAPMGVIAAHLGAPPPPPDAPGLWALGSTDRLADLMTNAGFQAPRFETLDATVEFPSAELFVTNTRRLAAPLRALFASLDPEARGAVEGKIREAVAPFAQPDGRLVMPEQMLVATARR